MNRDDVTGSQPRASARLDPAVDLHLARLQQLLRVGTMLREAGELEELADPDRLPGERDIEDWRLGHPAHSAPAREAADAVVQAVTTSAATSRSSVSNPCRPTFLAASNGSRCANWLLLFTEAQDKEGLAGSLGPVGTSCGASRM